MSEKVYKVGGMTCGGCAKSVSAAIGKAAPDATVAVDHAAGTVTIGGAVAEDTIKTAVETAGFDYQGVAA